MSEIKLKSSPENIKLINEGLEFQKKGMLDQAKECFETAISRESDNPILCNLLGSVYFQIKDYTKAERFFLRAYNIDTENVDFISNLGSLYKDIGNLNKAKQYLEKALTINIAHPIASLTYMNVLCSLKEYDKAKEIAEKLLENENNKRNFKLWHILAKADEGLGNFDEAILSAQKGLNINPQFISLYHVLLDCYLGKNTTNFLMEACRITLKLKPEDFKANFYLALCHYSNENYEKALELFKRLSYMYFDDNELFSRIGDCYSKLKDFNLAIENYQLCLQYSDEPSWKIMNHIGVCSNNINQYEQALEYFLKANEIEPDHPKILNNIGSAYHNLREFDKAQEYFNKSISNAPDLVITLNNMGLLFQDIGDHEKALKYFEKAISIETEGINDDLEHDKDVAMSNLGVVYQEVGDFDKAFQYFEKLINKDTSFETKASFNYAALLILNGKLEEGFKAMRARWHTSDVVVRPFPYKWYNGEDLSDKNLFIWGEQGIGDELMFGTILPKIINQPKKCILEVNNRLVSLFKRSFPDIQVYPMTKPAHPYIDEAKPDFKMPMGDLPLYYYPDLNYKIKEGYLKADPEKVKYFANKYKEYDNTLKIGISWHSKNENTGHQRTIPLEKFLPFFEDEVTIFNLQYGDCSKEIDQFKNKYNKEIICDDEVNPLNDMESFAALVDNLDLVISIANSTVHMAGALGIPAWVLTPKVPSWRWLMDREDSMWYNHLKLYRQTEWGKWDDVIDRVSIDLKKLKA